MTLLNLGKCSAASLDVLSGIFTDDFLPTLLPILNEALFHEDWLVNFIFFCHIFLFVILLLAFLTVCSLTGSSTECLTL